MDKLFISFFHSTPTSYRRFICQYKVTSSKVQHDSMLDFVPISIPAENFVCIQHCENKFNNGTFLIKHEFLPSRICTLQFFVKMMVK